MAAWQLFISNLKILYRNVQGLTWHIMLPLTLYLALSSVDLSVFLPEGLPYRAYLLPGILAFTIMHSGVYSLCFWLIDLRERGVIKRFMVTPLTYGQLLTSLILARMVLIYFQVFIIGTVGLIFLRGIMQGSILAILLLILLGGGIFLCIGFFVSVLSDSYDSAAPMTTAINLVFICLGNIFVPTSAFPEAIRFFASKLPITYLSEGLRNNFLYETTFRQTLPQILPLIGWLIGAFLLTVVVSNLRHRRNI
jgi:ABC-type multidrug transport system permease subunit